MSPSLRKWAGVGAQGVHRCREWFCLASPDGSPQPRAHPIPMGSAGYSCSPFGPPEKATGLAFELRGAPTRLVFLAGRVNGVGRPSDPGVGAQV